MQKKEKIKAIIFDVGGVLALQKSKYFFIKKKGTITFGVHEYISRKLKTPLDKWLDSVSPIYAKAVEGKLQKKTLQRISKKNNTSVKELTKLFKRAYKKNFKQNKQLFRHAFKLKKQGYKIAILSDQWYLSKEAIMPKKLYKKFNPVIVSCDVGMRKPQPQIYKLTLKKLKLPAKNCIFIDNQEWNIKPAKKLGIHTILYKNNQQLFKQLSKLL